jgi:hypothetical protein
MKEIQLNRGFVAQVDDEDYEWLNQWRWTVSETHGKCYARRSVVLDSGKQTTVFMHRIIAGTASDMETDHIDRNGLNNQRSNLRPCTASQNSMNGGKPNKPSFSQYKGVQWEKRRNYWYATITVRGKAHYLGSCTSEEAAARAYDAAARAHYGEFAWLNFPDESEGAA